MADLLQAMSEARSGPAAPPRIARRATFLILILAGLVASAFWGGGRLIRVAVETVSLRRVEEWAGSLVSVAGAGELDPCLLAAIVYAESRGRPEAVSQAGAVGLMQLMPASASDAALRLRLSTPTREELLADPHLNLRLGTSHLAWLLENRRDMSLEAVLIAYNAGLTKARRWFEEAGGYDAWRASELRQGRTGSLDYAIAVLRLRARFAERGRLHPPHMTRPESPSPY